jgi:hypothetical protein
MASIFGVEDETSMNQAAKQTLMPASCCVLAWLVFQTLKMEAICSFEKSTFTGLHGVMYSLIKLWRLLPYINLYSRFLQENNGTRTGGLNSKYGFHYCSVLSNQQQSILFPRQRSECQSYKGKYEYMPRLCKHI